MVLPTNLPSIQANELRIDNLFLLEDDTFLLVDYESTYKHENKLKYLAYVLRILERYYKKYGMNMQIRVLILYTADVTKKEASDFLDVRSVKMTIEQAFLSEFNSNSIKQNLSYKIKNQQALTEQELMEYILLPLTYPGLEKRKILFKNYLSWQRK